MANIKSSKKNILINARNRARNLHFRTRMKNAIKVAKEAIETQLPDRETILRNALRIIDKTASKGIITKKAAASKKSKLSVRLNASLGSNATAPAKESSTTKKKEKPSVAKASAKDSKETKKAVKKPASKAKSAAASDKEVTKKASSTKSKKAESETKSKGE